MGPVRVRTGPTIVPGPPHPSAAAFRGRGSMLGAVPDGGAPDGSGEDGGWVGLLVTGTGGGRLGAQRGSEGGGWPGSRWSRRVPGGSAPDGSSEGTGWVGGGSWCRPAQGSGPIFVPILRISCLPSATKARNPQDRRPGHSQSGHSGRAEARAAPKPTVRTDSAPRPAPQTLSARPSTENHTTDTPTGPHHQPPPPLHAPPSGTSRDPRRPAHHRPSLPSLGAQPPTHRPDGHYFGPFGVIVVPVTRVTMRCAGTPRVSAASRVTRPSADQARGRPFT
ncbi:hypothetical protein F4561_003520 [Lipingzhangella halophila]|uniref:Uncharacterized protein n=1 Tax=Lipingzhangella halophila TaxID=1783352 RepID=A0A7W7W4G0_9ACTN|nr:hypothetical protein [Lipingzhangella halophila]